MTKQRYVSDLRQGMALDQERFLLLEHSAAVARNGRPYLALTLGDRTGRIHARYCDVPEHVARRLHGAAALRVTGSVTSWQGALQLTLTAAEPCTAEPLDELVRSGPRPTAEMVDELRATITGVGNPWLRSLLECLLLDPHFLPRYAAAPAAKRNHHAWSGGLLAHSLALARAAAYVASHYPGVDRDLLLSAALLHDVGKVDEYTLLPSISFSDEGRLIGHVAGGALLVAQAIAAIPNFPADLRLRLLHAVLSHHGGPDKGSPVAPKTLEAVLLHRLDWLDGDTQAALDHLQAEPQNGSAWTSRCPMLEVELYRPAVLAVEPSS